MRFHWLRRTSSSDMSHVSLPLADLDSKLDPLSLKSYQILSLPTAKLSSIFRNPRDDLLHIWVDYPSELQWFSGSVFLTFSRCPGVGLHLI